MSHRGRPVIIILITASSSSKTYNVALDQNVSRLMERHQYWSDRDWCACMESVSARLVVSSSTRFFVALLHLLFWSPKDRERESHPCVNLHREREITSASVESCDTEVCFLHIQLLGTNVRLPKMKILLMLTSSLQGLLQNQSLETNLICIVTQCFPHNHIACIHMCDECRRSNAPSVCHKILSIFVFTRARCQVSQYEPNTDISKQLVSKLWIILQLIQFLLL